MNPMAFLMDPTTKMTKHINMLNVPQKLKIEPFITGNAFPKILPVHSENRGKIGVGIKVIKRDNFQYFSIKSYVAERY